MWNRSISLILVFGAAGMACALSGCGWRVLTEEAAGEEEHGEEEEEFAVGTLTPEEVQQAECSHGPTLECDECRYEVGVVKVDPALLEQAGAASTALMKTDLVPERKRHAVAVEISGEVRLNENRAVHVSPRIPGAINSVNVDIGSEVRKGDVLFSLESVELGQAMSEYVKNAALAGLAQKHFQREKRLFEEKIGSEMDMIDAQMRLEDYQTSLTASRQRLLVLGLTGDDIAEAGSSTEQGFRGSVSVRAPIDGTIIEKHAVPGEYVVPESATMILADLSTVWFWGALYERDLDAVVQRETGEPLSVEIMVPAYPDVTFHGQLDYIGSTMDEATRTVQVRTVVDNQDGRLRPGMFCQGRILVSTHEDVLSIPKEALLSDEGQDFVFTHMKDDYFLQQNVRKGRVFENEVEILEGLTPGQTIVTLGAFVLKSDVLRSKMGAGCAD